MGKPFQSFLTYRFRRREHLGCRKNEACFGGPSSYRLGCQARGK